MRKTKLGQELIAGMKEAIKSERGMKKRKKQFIGGRKISPEEAYAGLGDPSTWEADSKWLDAQQRKPFPCKVHPRYKVIRKPTSSCTVCKAAWRWKGKYGHIQKPRKGPGGGPIAHS